MTDNEIIKAFELCVYGDYAKCHYECPYKRHCSKLTKDALDLINRQKAEIENYSHNNKNMTDSIYKMQKLIESQKAEIERLRDVVDKTDAAYYRKVDEVRVAKAEAIKDFAETIVHCKDCANAWTTICGKRYCSRFRAAVSENDFCSLGTKSDKQKA